MIDDKRLRELIDCADVVCYLGDNGEDIDIESILIELQTLRQQNIALIEDAEQGFRFATSNDSYLLDGDERENEFFVWQSKHKALMQEIGGEQ